MITENTQLTLNQTDRITDGMQPLGTYNKQFRARTIEQQRGHQHTFREFILQKRDFYRSLDSSARLKKYCDVDKMIRYYDGDQYGSHDKNGVWTDDREDGDLAYSIPVLAGHVDQALMQMLKTKIEYEFTAKDENNVNKQAVASMCEQLAVEDYDRMFTEEMVYEETLNRLLATESYRYIFWASDPDNPKKVKRPVVKTEKVIVGESATITTKIDAFEEVTLGQNNLHIPHPMSIQRDLAAPRLSRSSFLIERKLVRKSHAQWQYQVMIDGDGKITEQSRLIDQQQKNTTQTDGIVGSANQQWLTAQGSNEKIEEEWIWMSPEDYGHFWLDIPESLPDGTQLEAGKLAGDVYPDGLLAVVIGNTIVRLRPISFRRKWVHVLLGKRLGTAQGKGFHSLMPLQDIVNDSFNLRYSIGMTHAHPTKVLDRKAAKTLNQVDEFLLVDAPNGVDGVLNVIPGANVNPDIVLTGEQMEAAMQFIAGTYTMGGGGAADVKAMGTATGVAAVQEQAAGRMYPHIMLKISADKETLFQILENWRDYASDEQKAELAKRFGPDVVKYFLTCNFRQELNITIAQNSDMPRSMALTQANILAYAQAATGLKDSPFAQEILGMMADSMGISINIGIGRIDKREAEYRLNKLMAIEEEIDRKVQNVPDVRKAQLMLGMLVKFEGQLVMPHLQDQASFMEVYKEWLFSERAKSASMALKASVIEMWGMHWNATIAEKEELAANENRFAQILNQPPQPSPEEMAMMQEQQAMQIEQQQAMEDRQRQNAIEDEALRYEAEEMAKDEQMRRDEAAKENQLARDKEAKEHETGMEIIKEAARANKEKQNEKKRSE